MAPTESPANGRSSYAQILHSSAIVGGATALTLGMGLVRNKALAILLGPSGFGLYGLYLAVVEFAKSFAGMGINQSGVRQIAERAASGGMDDVRITSLVLRRASVLLGLLGGLLVLAFAKPIAVSTFGDSTRTASVALLSIAVLMRLIADGQSALLQGLRRISELAKVNVLGGLYGAVAAIAIVYVFGEDGIVPSIVVAGFLTVVTAWWYVRRLRGAPIAISLPRFTSEVTALLKLGAAFMVSGFMMMGASYAVRSILANEEGLEAAGLYQAAWTLGGMYAGFILQAMGTDFYPRLVGVIEQPGQRTRLVNEQTIASLLLAGPGILGTLTLAPVLLSVLYSSQFVEGAATLRWLCVGMALRVVTWPPGFLIVAKNERAIFLLTEVAWAVINVALTVFLVDRIGLEGAGVAFAVSYVAHGFIVYSIAYVRYGFRLWREAFWMGAAYVVLIAMTMALVGVMSGVYGSLIAIIVTVAVSAVSLKMIVRKIPADSIPRSLRRALTIIKVL